MVLSTRTSPYSEAKQTNKSTFAGDFLFVFLFTKTSKYTQNIVDKKQFGDTLNNNFLFIFGRWSCWAKRPFAKLDAKCGVLWTSQAVILVLSMPLSMPKHAKAGTDISACAANFPMFCMDSICLTPCSSCPSTRYLHTKGALNWTFQLSISTAFLYVFCFGHLLCAELS